MLLQNPVTQTAKRVTLILYFVVLLAAAALSGYLGYDYGASSTYKAEHAAVESCNKELTDARLATLANRQAGQGQLTQGISSSSEALAESEKKRQELLRQLQVAQAANKNSKQPAGPSSPAPSSPLSDSACPVQVPTLPRTFARAVNALLEVSHETGFYYPR